MHAFIDASAPKNVNSIKKLKGDLDKLKFGGYLTLSQSGSSKYLVKALQTARELNLTCINVVNVEDSAITKVGEQIINDTEDQTTRDRNIGLYMKSGYCFCDTKSFIPQVVCMTLTALWFAAAKAKKTDSIRDFI